MAVAKTGSLSIADLGCGDAARESLASFDSWVSSSGMLASDGELGRAEVSVGVRKAWFNLGVLLRFMRLMARATPLNILVGVFGVLGRSNSSADLGS